MIAALLLARGGVSVTVLEKHADFLRDFRGDTVHPSTIALLDELGLYQEFTELPQLTKFEKVSFPLPNGRRLTAPRGALIFRRAGGLVCALNAGKRPMALPDGELILASAPLVDGQLPSDAAAWLVPSPG